MSSMKEYFTDVKRLKRHPYLKRTTKPYDSDDSDDSDEYISFSQATGKLYKENLRDNRSFYVKEMKMIQDRIDTLTDQLKEEHSQRGIMDKVGETLLSCAGCASRRSSAESNTSQKIKYYTKELEKLQRLDASEKKQMFDDLLHLYPAEADSIAPSVKKGGTMNVKKRSKKYRKSNKKTQRRRRIRKTKTQRTRI